MLRFGVVEARVGYPAVYLVLDGYSGILHDGEWPSLSAACATEGEIDHCVQFHREALEKAAAAAKRKLRGLRYAVSASSPI